MIKYIFDAIVYEHTPIPKFADKDILDTISRIKYDSLNELVEDNLDWNDDETEVEYIAIIKLHAENSTVKLEPCIIKVTRTVSFEFKSK